jgi:ATP-dependent RNA helicase RhlE
MTFDHLSLKEPLLRSLADAGYREATPIQQQAIPQIVKGRDLIGCAQTGTGKTAAFALPTLQRLMTTAAPQTGAAHRRKRSGRRIIRALALAPTRELAGQIEESLATYGKFTGLRQTVIFGGIRQGSQVRALQAGVDILVATPGRLLDLIGQGFIDLSAVEVLILDEADQMLDMGFIHDLRKIVSRVPAARQTLMFSATMSPEIRKLASEWLRRPFEVRVTAKAATPELVSQAVYFVERHLKAATLSRFLKETRSSKTLVFSRTKRGADKIARLLQRDGIQAVAIHGNKSQARRKAVMLEFNSKRPPVLVATDLAARGLDFTDVSHVINFELPDAPETYVHRIGRTARAGASGQAISFCGQDERRQLRLIEKLTGQAIPVKGLQRQKARK